MEKVLTMIYPLYCINHHINASGFMLISCQEPIFYRWNLRIVLVTLPTLQNGPSEEFSFGT